MSQRESVVTGRSRSIRGAIHAPIRACASLRAKPPPIPTTRRAQRHPMAPESHSCDCPVYGGPGFMTKSAAGFSLHLVEPIPLHLWHRRSGGGPTGRTPVPQSGCGRRPRCATGWPPELLCSRDCRGRFPSRHIRSDNGPEFIVRALRRFLEQAVYFCISNATSCYHNRIGSVLACTKERSSGCLRATWSDSCSACS